MEIKTQYNTYTTNFKAKLVASTQNYIRGTTTNIDIFKLSREDKHFLKLLQDKVSIKEFCPNLAKDIQERWQKVFNYCIEGARENYIDSYIAISEGRPCGIMTSFNESAKNYFLDGISSIPNKTGKKINLAGDTLLYQLFLNAKRNKGQNITLKAIHNGPKDVVKKYKSLGFTEIDSDGHYTLMHCNKHKVMSQINKFSEQINYKEAKDDEFCDLEQFLD